MVDLSVLEILDALRWETRQELVVRLGCGGAQTARTLATAMNCPLTTVRSNLRRLEEAGVVRASPQRPTQYALGSGVAVARSRGEVVVRARARSGGFVELSRPEWKRLA